jgi:chemotaxis protein CheC
MTENPESKDININNLQEIIVHGFQNAAKGFSGMIGEVMQVIDPSVKAISLKDIPMFLGSPENDAVGIYLRVEGDISGQIMLILPYDKALEIVDLLFEQPFGTTKTLGQMERSALAEVGNMTGAFFLNAVAEITGISARPTPPAVMVDMVGAILDVIIATMGQVDHRVFNDKVLMFQSNFSIGNRETKANFWIIPDPGTLEKLSPTGDK